MIYIKMKKYIRISLVFFVVSIVSGVFYREFTKAMDLGHVYTPLGLAHSHFLVLGVLFVLVFGLINLKFNNEGSKLFKYGLIGYIVGASGTGIMLVVRGIFDVLLQAKKISEVSGDAAWSGISGIFHIILGISIVMIFISWLKNKNEN